MSKTKQYFNKSLIAISISTFLSLAYAAEGENEEKVNYVQPHSIIGLSDELSAKYSGKGVKVGVLDSGFMPDHPQQSDKLHLLKFQLKTDDGEVRSYDPGYHQFEVKPNEEKGENEGNKENEEGKKGNEEGEKSDKLIKSKKIANIAETEEEGAEEGKNEGENSGEKPEFLISYETHGLGVSGVIGSKAGSFKAENNDTKQTEFKGGVAKNAEIYVSTSVRKRSLEELIAEAKKEGKKPEKPESEEDENKEPDFKKLEKSDLLVSKTKEQAFERIEWATALNKLVEKNLFAINNSWNIDPISNNISHYDKFYSAAVKDRNNPLIQAIINAKNKNTLLVFAAGNESKKEPGIMALLPRYLPELERHYLSVVAVDEKRKITSYSNHCGSSKQWCVAAPGNLYVLNSAPKKDSSGQYKPEHGLSGEEGTSFAAPVVTGALAILKQRFSYLSPTQVRDTLLTTATDLGDPGVDSVYGWGLINISQAVKGPKQFLADEAVNVTQDDNWSNDFSSRFKFIKKGNKSLTLEGKNTFSDLIVDQGSMNLSGKTRAKNIINNANIGVNQTDVEHGYYSSNGSQLTILGKTGIIAKNEASIQLDGTLKIEDYLTENSQAGDTSTTLVKLDDKSSYQGGFKKLVSNANLTKRGLIQDLYFKDKEIIAKVNSNTAITDKNADNNGQAGLSLLNKLRTSSIAYRRGFYNDWLQSAIEQHKLDNLHYAVSNNIYAESLELLRAQNAKQLTQTQQNLFNSVNSPKKTLVWTEHSGQKQSASKTHSTEVTHHQSELGISHKTTEKAIFLATLTQQKNELKKSFANSTLKQTALNIGLRYNIEKWFTETALQLARQKYTQTRQFKQHQLGKGETKGSSIGGEVRLGYQFTPNQWIIEPSFGIQLVQTKMNELKEYGELATTTPNIRYRDVNLVPSIKLQRLFKFEQGSISPYIGLNYIHRLNGKTTKVTSNTEGYIFHSETSVKRNHIWNSELGIQLQYKNWFGSINLAYDKFNTTKSLGWKGKIGFTF